MKAMMSQVMMMMRIQLTISSKIREIREITDRVHFPVTMTKVGNQLVSIKNKMIAKIGKRVISVSHISPILTKCHK